jgi:cytochrome P450
MAGADSTATALRCTLFYIITNPVVWNKLRAAIDDAADKNLSATFIPATTLRNVRYLQAVVKEGLRMWPPLTGTRVKVAPPEGWIVGNKFIPGGTEVGQCVWGLRNDVGSFGPDAALFRPDRWLEADSKQLQRMEDAVSTVFGNGRHRCLGKTIASLELDKVMAEVSRFSRIYSTLGIMLTTLLTNQLVRAFDMTIVDPTHPFRTRCNGIHLQSNMNVLANRRKAR